MSRFIQGDCVRVMATFPGNAVDFILTDPPYLVGFRDRQGRTIAGDKTDEWLQPACNEMYRVLKKDALMVSFYGWNRVDRFMAAWKNAGFSVVGHLVFNWTMNGEYGSEFGGFFPVQVRFTPAHERFHLALCSPGDVSQVWVLVLVNAGGEPFAVVQVQRRFASEAVSHSLALAASLDTQGYSVNDIIHILMAEGGQV